MRVRKMFRVCVLLAAFLVGLSACGNKPAASPGGSEAAETTAGTTAPMQEVSGARAVPDAASGVDELLGKWKDISDAGRFAVIAKDKDAYRYEDNEGQYPAAFASGKLTVKTPDGTAEAYLDRDTGHLLVVFGEDQEEFEKVKE